MRIEQYLERVRAANREDLHAHRLADNLAIGIEGSYERVVQLLQESPHFELTSDPQELKSTLRERAQEFSERLGYLLREGRLTETEDLTFLVRNAEPITEDEFLAYAQAGGLHVPDIPETRSSAWFAYTHRAEGIEGEQLQISGGRGWSASLGHHIETRQNDPQYPAIQQFLTERARTTITMHPGYDDTGVTEEGREMFLAVAEGLLVHNGIPFYLPSVYTLDRMDTEGLEIIPVHDPIK